MPPRWLGAAIVAWWLAMMGWLFWHDLWPSWRPGEPPRFHIDLVEEVQHSGEGPKIYWNVYRQKNDEKPEEIFRAESWVEYRREDDTFALHAKLKGKTKEKYVLKLARFEFEVRSMSSKYRVNRLGQLRELQFEVNLSPSEEPKKPLQLEVWGEVRDDQFFAHCQVDASLGTPGGEIDLPPAPVSHNASVLLPLHPVNRIHGLYPGQSWRQPLVDPLGGTLLGGGGVHYLNARVLPQLQVLEEDDEETTCLVIEYEDEGQLVGRTWVERDSERVQQQETLHDSEHWTMKRDDPRKAINKKHPVPHPPADSRGLNHD
jgi:hypothetical protein